MKKLPLFLALTLCASVFLAGCSKDDPDMHTLNIRAVSSDSNPIGYYADQTSDSVEVVSTDSWNANTNCDWIKFRQTALSTVGYKFAYVYGQALSKKERIVLDANTTGEDRMTTINVEANGKKVGLVVKQLGHLNVTEPAKSQTVNTPLFVMRLNGGAASAKVAFTVYDRTRITTEDTWITVSGDVFEGTCKGVAFETSVSLASNTTGVERTGKVTLVSATGAKTDIEVVQGI